MKEKNDEAFTKALRKIGTPLTDIQAVKRAALSDFQAQVLPFQEHAKAAINGINELIANEIEPFLAEMAKVKLNDAQINQALFQLEQVQNKPGELQMHLAQSKGITWENLRQTTYPDRVDQGKFDSLVRFYRTKLTGFGDVHGAARRAIAQIKSRVLFIAQSGGAVVESIPLETSPREADEDAEVPAPTPRRRTIAAPNERAATNLSQDE
jgi:hypothetical protein